MVLMTGVVFIIISFICFPGKQINKEQIQALAPQWSHKEHHMSCEQGKQCEKMEQFPDHLDEYTGLIFIITMPIHLN